MVFISSNLVNRVPDVNKNKGVAETAPGDAEYDGFDLNEFFEVFA